MTTEQLIFITNIANACKVNERYNILPSLTIAQAIKESNWGKSKLASLYFNFFGMKWTPNCGCECVEFPTKEWNGTSYISITARFRKYKDFNDGIKGYYDFLSYNRYKNLIGVKNSYLACKLIQQDGWATSPTYAESLYNDYILKYNLIKYDTDFGVNKYVSGSVYTLDVNLYVRNKPNGEAIKYDNLCDGYKGNSKFDEFGCAILLKGCRIICKSTRVIDNQIWIEISIGWICAVNDGKEYIK